MIVGRRFRRDHDASGRKRIGDRESASHEARTKTIDGVTGPHRASRRYKGPVTLSFGWCVGVNELGDQILP